MTTTLKIPKEVEIGGLLYTIHYPYEFEEGPESNKVDGLQTWPDCTVCIKKQHNNQRLVEILIHELFHAIDYVYTDYVLSDNEPLHDRFSSALYYVFSHNKIITNSKIPKYVDILGYKYNISDKVCFEDCVKIYASCSNRSKQFIMLAKSAFDVDISLVNRKIELINSILKMIQQILQVSEEERRIMCVHSLSQGIYQVFRNANIEELAWESRRS